MPRAPQRRTKRWGVFQKAKQTGRADLPWRGGLLAHHRRFCRNRGGRSRGTGKTRGDGAQEGNPDGGARKDADADTTARATQELTPPPKKAVLARRAMGKTTARGKNMVAERERARLPGRTFPPQGAPSRRPSTRARGRQKMLPPRAHFHKNSDRPPRERGGNRGGGNSSILRGPSTPVCPSPPRAAYSRASGPVLPLSHVPLPPLPLPPALSPGVGEGR